MAKDTLWAVNDEVTKKPTLMLNRLGTGHIITIFVYWIVSYVMLPSLRPFAVHGIWEDLAALGWIDLFCNALNGIVVALIMKDYLADDFFDVQIVPKLYVKEVSSAVMLMLLWVVLLSIGAEALFGWLLLMSDFVPLSEMGMTMSTGLLIEAHPVIGTLCMTFLVPFTICGFFYATAFGPLCCRKPWLGYLNVAFVLLLSTGIQIFWFKEVLYPLIGYVLTLPVHLIACRSYQKTDNLWTPIFSVGVFNLLSSLLFLFCGYFL